MSNETPKMSRKTFLRLGIAAGAGIAAGLSGWFLTRDEKVKLSISGSIPGASADRGHKIREYDFPAPSHTEQIPVVIVGAGIAGLSAARKLWKNGLQDFVILDLEAHPGGNSAWGKNEISEYPLGAHYLPIPHLGQTELIEALEEWGAITGFNAEGLPEYNPYYLCFEPKARLKISGQWQPGITPQLGVPEADSAQIRAFKSFCHEMEGAIGADGKRAFTLPLADCSADPAFTQWDEIPFSEFLKTKGWNSRYLLWYLNYCCRDDYGATIENVSAWAGIHYFASRGGEAANAEEDAILTWPEGNGWLVKKLMAPFSDKIRPGALAWKVENTDSGARVNYYDFATENSISLEARKVILATPRFVNERIFLHDSADKNPKPVYAPWVVANIKLKERPEPQAGTPLSWDNVAFDSPSLGYVVADHQQTLGFTPKPTNFTWYYPVSDRPPHEARKWLLESTYEWWETFILKDLEFIHKGISDQVQEISVWKWGHGMISPKPGYIWNPNRETMQQPVEHVHFAHSDLSGISIFEEAFYHGNRVAAEILSLWKT